MRIRHPLAQLLIIVLAAFVLAVVSNAFAARTRRMLLVGFYPKARVVPPRVPDRVAPPPQPAPVAVETAAPETTATSTASTTATVTATEAVEPATPSPNAPVKSAEQKPAVSTATSSAPEPAKPAVDVLSRFRPHPDNAYVELGGDDVTQLYRAGVLFLDARRTNVYEEGHIAGARSFPIWEADIDERVNGLFAERSDPEQQNEPIVIYCSGGACEDSHMLAQKLWGIQFNNVYVYKDGFPDWQQRNGAIRTGAKP